MDVRSLLSSSRVLLDGKADAARTPTLATVVSRRGIPCALFKISRQIPVERLYVHLGPATPNEHGLDVCGAAHHEPKSDFANLELQLAVHDRLLDVEQPWLRRIASFARLAASAQVAEVDRNPASVATLRVYETEADSLGDRLFTRLGTEPPTSIG
jgi:hypothetical protein